MSVMFDPEAAIYPFPPKPTPLSIDEKTHYREKIKRLLKERNAVMVAHYYTNPEIQQLAEETGGCISHSLGMGPFFGPTSQKCPIRWKWLVLVHNIPRLRC